ncbi:HlyD family secretion protein [Runella sp. SP2]|uniref:HlyD family secretion protein n=1 Tax=Runella sp. SP2 TaxID=2268026 RepID=UPI000F093340|nr:HlyD family efflux transporter periplasmic adaptor subunit [Runella sp. SP2]AYQ34082.1 HlyD family efflux transporter periplasmic adaptor subunit [Runella sp. SP2]
MTKEENDLFTDRPEGAALFEELRNEDLQEVLGHQPPWIVQWGNSLFLLILAGVMVLAWVIQYPEIVTARFRLTSDNAPSPVVARTNGRLVKLSVREHEQVREGQLLGYVESTASPQQVAALEKQLETIAKWVNTNRFDLLSVVGNSDFEQLGELQADYQAFIQQFNETSTLFANGYLAKKQDFLRQELADLRQNHEHLKAQLEIQREEFALVEKEFKMHQQLFQERVIAAVEMNREERNYLNKKMPLKQLEMNITTNGTAQLQKQKEMAELEKQANDQKVKCSQALHTLRASLMAWKVRYLLIAPKNGQVYFTSLWQETQLVKAEDVLFYVGNPQNNAVGEVKIPQQNGGKVKVGQRVIIKFQSYPFEQFGVVAGQLQTIASVPSSDSTFLAFVVLPKGLQTSTHKMLPFKNGLNATAEIVTDDVSVAERMLYEVRKLWK